MPTPCWALRRLPAILLLVCVAAPLATGGSASANQPGYVKYYKVAASYQGAPENLTEIAIRFLGDGGRSAEIYNLNAGRIQPDGSGLTDPAKLRAGWLLVLPWDAVGDGVVQGLLPTGKGASGSASPSAASPKPRPNTTDSRPRGTSASATPRPSASVSAPSSGGGNQAQATCVTKTAATRPSDWARQRLAPDQAWKHSRGEGIMVAVVDSGVDSSLHQLSGRVSVGADITAGTGRGDVDCIGSGTAMAGIIAAAADDESSPVGVAPDATIVPIRVVDDAKSATASNQVTAIEVAVSTGASVIALGSFVGLDDPAVTAAITKALGHDVLIVAAAPTGSAPRSSPSGGSTAGAVLIVGGVDSGGKLAATYPDGVIDVVAPGVDALTREGNGSGADSGGQYAVAYAAGQAALVRAAVPELSATEVKDRIRQTADKMGSGQPDQQYGWGMINIAAAVDGGSSAGGDTATDERSSDSGGGAGRTIAMILIFMIILVAATFLVVQMRRRRTGEFE